MAVGVTCALAATLAHGQGSQGLRHYPTKPIRTIVPYQPGGIADTLGRLVAQRLGAAWNQSVVVENRPGGSTNIGSELVARAAPDGYTLLWSGIANTVAPALFPKLPYDPLRDFVWITNLAKVPILIAVHPALPVRSTRDLVALAKARPGELLYGSSGIATSGHLGAELLMNMTGTRMIHVPYKGAAGTMVDVLSGQLAIYFGAIGTPLPHVRSGRLRALAVTTLARSPAAPNVPTLSEEGFKGMEFSTWYAISAPTGTPADIIAKLNSEIVRIVRQPDLRERLAAEGSMVVGDSSEEFTAFVKSEITRWGRVVKQSGIRAE
jgi:tripartite-type tricarboxylate transporter receptor subunit TctC